jgi:hypothetical protein
MNQLDPVAFRVTERRPTRLVVLAHAAIKGNAARRQHRHRHVNIAHLEMWRPGVTPSGGQHPQAEYIVVKVRGASHIARWHAGHSNSFQHGRLHNKNAASHTADRSIADLLA